MTRVLVTGVGGPAGVAVLRSLLRRPDVDAFAGDMDGWASGLYLVPAERRRILKPGLSPDFVDDIRRICADDAIDVVISTVDVELPPLAAHRGELGAVLAAPSEATLAVTLDKWELAQRCAPLLRVPVTRLLNADGMALRWHFPVIVKPRRGAGSRGVRIVADRAALTALDPDEALIIQEFLPAIGLRGVANVQLRRDSEGTPALLEVNPRFPGALPLTIAAGVDMPSLVLDLAVGVDIPSTIEFAEIANVRYLEDIFVPIGEILHSENAAHQEDPGDE